MLASTWLCRRISSLSLLYLLFSPIPSHPTPDAHSQEVPLQVSSNRAREPAGGERYPQVRAGDRKAQAQAIGSSRTRMMPC